MPQLQELDPESLAAAQRGEVAAQERLYRCYIDRVQSLAYRLMKERADAQDIAQESFIRCFEALKQYRGEAPLWAWLKQVTIRTALSRLRSQRRWHWVSFDHWHLSREEDSCGTVLECSRSGDTDQAQQQMDLASALEQLSSTARAVVYLYHAEGYSHAEIAEMWGKSVSFSKSQLARAHQRLREALLAQESSLKNSSSTASGTVYKAAPAPSLGLVKELLS